MAFEYGKTDTNPGEKFQNSQFLVFMNRILAFFVAVMYMFCTRQPKHTAPLYKYSYSSFSNIMSSWCQYEALKYVSFPVQVLAKASKVIPVMLMGKIVSQKTYKLYEYITAILISLGVGVFMLASEDGVQGDGKATTISGIVILIGYLTFDSFTSNWQGELFRQHHMTSMQMMAGVNLFSVVFTTVSLTEQGGFIESIAFMGKYPAFVFHVTLLSITSATGQLFIFYTISRFGPVTFTIIMTIRQGVAILLSCIIYHHPVNIKGLFGIGIVFGAIITRIYCNHNSKKPTPPRIAPEDPNVIIATPSKA
jgi:adenosine 3'-phospho 5'-phosphosulfate transporter B2